MPERIRCRRLPMLLLGAAVALAACAAGPGAAADPATLSGEVRACPPVEGRLSVDLEPPAGRVSVEGRGFRIEGIPAGSYELSIRLGERLRDRRRLSLGAGERRDLGTLDLQAEILCPAIYEPVCGTDGRTYGNACEAGRACAEVAHEGPCEAP